MNPDLQRHQARNLFFQTDMKRADIAAIVGVSDRTLYRWIQQDNWKQMKIAARQAPIAIVEMLYRQLHSLNDTICQRDEGLGTPTMEEAEITRKLILSISKLKQQASFSENIQVLMGFTGFLNRMDNALGKQVVLYADKYLKDKQGYAPFGFDEDDDDEVFEQDEDVETEETTVPQPSATKHAFSPAKSPGRVTARSQKLVITEDMLADTPQSPATSQFRVGSPAGSRNPEPLSAAEHVQDKQPAPEPQLSAFMQERLLAQHKAKQAILDEMHRSLDKPSKSKYHW